jgi:hypothetical protein
VSDVTDVRLLISDVGGDSEVDFIFEDADIERFLELRGNNVFRAASTALRTIAGNEALVSKRIKFLELTTDGPAVSKELRELAKELETIADDGTDIEIIEMATDEFSRRYLRGLTR